MFAKLPYENSAQGHFMTGFVSSVVVVITFQIDKYEMYDEFLENIEKHK